MDLIGLLKTEGKKYLQDSFGGILNPEWTPERAKTAGGLLLDMTPVVGDIKSGYEGIQAAKQGDYLGAGLGALGALPLVPNMAGMFIGKGAKTWDAVKASQAMDMEKAGVDPRKIWSETGNWKGPDGKWRQEIPDNKSTWVPSKEFLTGDGLALQHQVMNHEKLMDSYPELGNVVVKRGDMRGGSFSGVSENGKLLPEFSDITIGTSAARKSPSGYAVNVDQGKSINLHELQHAVQETEGFARGGSSAFAFNNPEAFQILQRIKENIAKPMSIQDYAKQAWGTSSITKEVADDYKNYLKTTRSAFTPEIERSAQETAAKEYYKRLAGEAEARATQARMNMDMAERLRTFPADSYDVPLDQLIIRGVLGR